MVVVVVVVVVLVVVVVQCCEIHGTCTVHAKLPMSVNDNYTYNLPRGLGILFSSRPSPKSKESAKHLLADLMSSSPLIFKTVDPAIPKLHKFFRADDSTYK